MKRPVATTIFFGFISALLFLPVTSFVAPYWGWVMVFKIFTYLNLALYSALLCRWSRTPLTMLIFPLVLVAGVMVWPYSYPGFIVFTFAVFSWIRSGICFHSNPVRASVTESVTMVGCMVVILMWWPDSSLSQPLAILLFFLIQALYFFFIPEGAWEPASPGKDSFEQARREVERLLDQTPTW